jgi:hypothetical protein
VPFRSLGQRGYDGLNMYLGLKKKRFPESAGETFVMRSFGRQIWRHKDNIRMDLIQINELKEAQSWNQQKN